MYSEEDPEKATLRITIDVGEKIASLLQHINDSVFSNNSFLPNKSSKVVFKYNHLMKDTTLAMVSSLFKPIDEWKNDHEGFDTPIIKKDEDPNGWIQKIANDFVYCPEDFCNFYHITDDSIEPTKHTEIKRDDCIQAKIRFAPYAFIQKKGGVAGIRTLMEDVVVIKKFPLVC